MALANVARGATATSATATTSVTITPVTHPIAGDTIIVAVAVAASDSTVAVTDNASPPNKYIIVAGPVLNTGQITMFASRNIANAPTTITVTFASSRYGIAIATYTGVGGFRQAKNTGTGTTSPATETLANALLTSDWTLAAFGNKGTGTWGTSTGNLRNNVAGAGSTTPGAAIVDSTTTTAAATLSATTLWEGCAVELLIHPLFKKTQTYLGAKVGSHPATA